MIYKPEDFINSIYYDQIGFVYLVKFLKKISRNNKFYNEYLYLKYDRPYNANDFAKITETFLSFDIENTSIPKTNLQKDIIYVGTAASKEEALQICKEYLVFI